MPILNSLLKNSFFGIVTNLLNRVGNILLLVLIIQAGSLDTAGSFDLAISYFFVASRIAFWGLDQILTRDVARDRSLHAVYIVNFLLARLVLSLGVLALVVGGLSFSGYSAETKLLITISLIAVVPEAINNLCQGVFAAFEEQWFTSLATFANLLCKLGLGIWLVSSGYGLIAVMSAIVMGHVAAMLINLAVVAQRYQVKWQRPSRAFLLSQWRVALPFFFIGSFYILDNRVDRILLSFFSNNVEIGIYATASAIMVALQLPIEAYRMAFFPILSKHHQAEDATTFNTLIEQSMQYCMLAALPIATGVFIVAPSLIMLVYRQAIPDAELALRIMIASLPLTYANVLYNRLMIVQGRQIKTAQFLCLAAVTNIALNVALMPLLGAVGASIGRVVSALILLLCNQFTIRIQTHFVDYGLAQFLKLCAITVAMAAVVGILQPFGLFVQVLVGVVTFVGLALVAKLITQNDLRFVTATLQKRRNTLD